MKGSPGTTSISGKRSTIALTYVTMQLLWAFASTSEKQCQLPGNKMLGAGKLTATDLPVPLSHDEHTANFGVYNVQQNGKFHVLLASYFDKGEGWDSFDRLCSLCNDCCNGMALHISTLLTPLRLQKACPALAGPKLGSAQWPATKVLGPAVLQRARVERLR